MVNNLYKEYVCKYPTKNKMLQYKKYLFRCD